MSWHSSVYLFISGLCGFGGGCSADLAESTLNKSFAGGIFIRFITQYLVDSNLEFRKFAQDLLYDILTKLELDERYQVRWWNGCALQSNCRSTIGVAWLCSSSGFTLFFACWLQAPSSKTQIANLFFPLVILFLDLLPDYMRLTRQPLEPVEVHSILFFSLPLAEKEWHDRSLWHDEKGS